MAYSTTASPPRMRNRDSHRTPLGAGADGGAPAGLPVEGVDGLMVAARAYHGAAAGPTPPTDAIAEGAACPPSYRQLRHDRRSGARSTQPTCLPPMTEED